MSALQDALNKQLGVDPNAVDKTEIDAILAAIKEIQPHMTAVAADNNTQDTLAILKAFVAIAPEILAVLAADPMRVKRYLHAQEIGDASVTLPGFGNGSAPAQSEARPAAALGSSTGTTDDPLVDEFRQMLDSNRAVAESYMDFFRRTVGLRQRDEDGFNQLSGAILNLVDANTADRRPTHGSLTEWLLQAGPGGNPQLVALANALDEVRNTRSQLGPLRQKIDEINSGRRVLNAAAGIARRARTALHDSGSGDPMFAEPHRLNDMAAALEEMAQKIEEAQLAAATTTSGPSPTARRTPRPATRMPRTTTP